jgi:hypothetical protein
MTRDFAECGHDVFSIWDACPTFASRAKARHHLSHRQNDLGDKQGPNDPKRSIFFGPAD